MQELSKDLSRNPHQLLAKVILIQRIGFSKKKKKKIINQNFQFLQKIQGYQIFQKKKKKSSIKIFNSFKKFKFSKLRKKKKKTSLNYSSGTESSDPFPYFPVVQHQVNFQPLAFIEAWNMSQTRGIHQVCQSLFNE